MKGNEDHTKLFNLLRTPCMKTVRYDAKYDIAAISASPDGAEAVIAGRDVIRILGLEENGDFRERISLRVGRTNLSSSCADVAWHVLPSKCLPLSLSLCVMHTRSESCNRVRLR